MAFLISFSKHHNAFRIAQNQRRSKRSGIFDAQTKVFYSRDIFIDNGSMIYANIGVNPSLTITAITESAMSTIPPKQTNNSF